MANPEFNKDIKPTYPKYGRDRCIVIGSNVIDTLRGGILLTKNKAVATVELGRRGLQLDIGRDSSKRPKSVQDPQPNPSDYAD